MLDVQQRAETGRPRPRPRPSIAEQQRRSQSWERALGGPRWDGATFAEQSINDEAAYARQSTARPALRQRAAGFVARVTGHSGAADAARHSAA